MKPNSDVAECNTFKGVENKTYVIAHIKNVTQKLCPLNLLIRDPHSMWKTENTSTIYFRNELVVEVICVSAPIGGRFYMWDPCLMIGSLFINSQLNEKKYLHNNFGAMFWLIMRVCFTCALLMDPCVELTLTWEPGAIYVNIIDLNV